MTVSPLDNASGKRPFILIVDDVPENLHALMNILRNDYAITAATSGAEALELANGQPTPDLILLDIRMPRMDGYQVLEALKQDPLTAGIPVIFVTALTELADEARGLRLGADDYLTKPLAPELVLSRVGNCIELNRYRRYAAVREAGGDVRATLLIVDDVAENIHSLAEVLKDDYRIQVATSGMQALDTAGGAQRPDLILLDIVMPEMDGYTACKLLKANPATRGIPVIFVTALNEAADETQGLQLGAVDYLTKPINPAIVRARIQTHLALRNQTRELERLVDLRTAELEMTRRQIIYRLGRAAEFKDYETGNHVLRVSHYARLIGAAAGMDAAAVSILFNVVPLHDVGKMGIPDYILRKPGPFDADERSVIKRHPIIGAEIIGQHEDELLKTAYLVSLTHHERWDGSGYPNRLRGEEIPLVGRIVAIADVFDALISRRPYKEAWPVEQAVEYITDNAGKYFDPKLVDAFRSVLPEILAVKDKYTG
jgi:putative two-component system response regulator